MSAIGKHRRLPMPFYIRGFGLSVVVWAALMLLSAPSRTRADEAPPAKKPAPQPNPLTDLIRGLQGKPGGQTGRPPIKMPEVPAGGTQRKTADRHNTDPRAPYDRKATEGLRKAAELARANEWKEALELLQRVTERPEDSLYRNETGQWISVRTEADRLRGEAPPDVMAEYRTRYGGLARQLLNEARHGGDIAALGLVAKGYFHTEAGYEAANRLGSLHLDRGEFALAARWFAALWQAKAPLTSDRQWCAKAGYALKQAGQMELATAVVGASPEASPVPVDLGGTRYNAAQWLSQVARAVAPVDSPLLDWPVFYGTPRRTGVAAGGEPLLLPRWRQPLTASHPVQSQIDQLTEDLSDQGTTAPTVLFPVMIAGKVVFRTLHGVQVVDATSGRLLWETEELQPLEKLLSGGGGRVETADDEMFLAGNFNRMGRNRWSSRMSFSGGTGEYSPLCNLLYRNANFGIVSSDGRQLFVVDDPVFLTNLQPGNAWQWEGNRSGLVDAGSKLTSYELETGRLLWEVGGRAQGEPFDPPLAGYYFFGAPVPDRGELFVVAESTAGEKAGQIRLLSLDPESGAEKWSQLIAYSDPAPIEKDMGRRWWAAPVAVGNGILICPTTVGWTVAVDRVTHSLLWGHRSPQPGINQQRASGTAEQHEAMAMVQNTPLGATWSAAPPILAGGRVVSTPLEAQSIICLDQFTGKELWTKPRGSSQYLAGVFDGKVLVVGREATIAFDLETGAPAWTPVKTPAPSGRGIAVAGRYELPLSTGEVWSIDVASGTVAGKTLLPPQVATIGNLAMYRGMLLSLDASGLTAFEQRDAVQEEIATRKRADPQDPWALVREAEISMLNQDFAGALKSLRQTAGRALSTDLAERRRKLSIEALRAAIRADFSRPATDDDLRELLATVVTADERRLVHQLEADLAVARQEFSKAFDAYLKIADDDSAPPVSRDDTPATVVRARLWVAGKLADLLAAIPAEAKARFDERIARLADQALNRSIEAQEKFLELFSDHSTTLRIRWKLAEAYASRGEFVRAEHVLLRLAREPAAATAAAAHERLARLMVQFELPADAAEEYRTLERDFADVPLSDGRTAAQTVQALRDAGRLPEAGSPVMDWQATGIRVERTGSNYQNHVPQELLATGSAAPYFQRNRLEVEHTRQRLEITDGWSDERRWSLPLRSHASSTEGSLAIGRSTGHQMTLLYRGVLHCLSPVEHKLLWARPLDHRQAAQGNYGRNTNPLQPMQASLNLANRQAYNQNSAGGGPLAVANDEYVCYQGRRKITMLDVNTGEVRWTYSGGRAVGSVFGGTNVIFLRPADGRGVVALRAADGKRLDVRNLDETLNRAIHVVGDAFVLPGSRGGLRLYDPVAERDLWKVELGRLKMSPLDNDRLAVLQTDAQQGANFQLLDLRSGKLQLLGTLGPEEMKGASEQFTFADSQNVYLMVNKGMNANFSSEQVPSVRANGLLLAFDARQSKLRWKHSIAAQNLLLERLDYSPLLVFAARQHEQKGKLQFWSLHLVAIDKLSGAKLLDEKSASQQGFRSVSVSAAERYIELRGYNDRVRLYPIEKSAAAGESGD